MIVRRTTRLPIGADAAWALIQRPDTFLHVTRGALGVRGELSNDWRAGDVFHLRLLLGGVVPAWRHELRVVSADPARREIRTAEHGGPLRRWNHRLAVVPDGPGASRYTDEIDIDAPPLTPVAWTMAHAFFAYRQARLRRLARSAAAAGGARSAGR